MLPICDSVTISSLHPTILLTKEHLSIPLQPLKCRYGSNVSTIVDADEP